MPASASPFMPVNSAAPFRCAMRSTSSSHRGLAMVCGRSKIRTWCDASRRAAWCWKSAPAPISRSDFFRASRPIRCGMFYDMGLKVTLNSDDPPFFHSSLAREYEVAATQMEFTDAELNAMTRTALEAAFVDDRHAERGSTFAALTGDEPGETPIVRLRHCAPGMKKREVILAHIQKARSHERRHRHQSSACAAQTHDHAQEGDLDRRLPPAAARDLDAAVL